MRTLLRTRSHLTQVRFSIRMLFQPLPLIILVIKKYVLMSILNFSLRSFKPLLLIISSSENYLLYIYCYSEAIYKPWWHPSWIFTVIDYINSAPSMPPLIIFSLILLSFLSHFVFLWFSAAFLNGAILLLTKSIFYQWQKKMSKEKAFF